MSERVCTEGFVIRRQPFSNTSLIIRWITAEHGLVTTMARGAGGPKSKWRATLDLYHRCELQYRRSRSSNMHALADVTLLEANIGLRCSYTKLLCAEYFAALLGEISEPDAPLADEYDVFSKAIVYLAAHDPSEKLIQRFEARILHAGGIHHDNSFESGHPREDAPAYGRRAPLEAASVAHDFRIPPQRARLFKELLGSSPKTG